MKRQKDCDDAGPTGSTVEQPFRKFQSALKPSYQNLRVRWLEFPSLWDAIDCHMARMKGWKAVSWDHPDLNFEHLRPMGSSEVSIWEGRHSVPTRLTCNGE